MKEKVEKDEKRKNTADEKEAGRFKPCIKPSEDIDDFIFENERYEHSEK